MNKGPSEVDATWAIAEGIARDGPVTREEAAQLSAGVDYGGWCALPRWKRSYNRARALRILCAGADAGFIVCEGEVWAKIG